MLGDLRMAIPAGLRDVGLERGALRILAAENFVRSVAALAVGGHQQAFVGQRRAVNRILVRREHRRQPVLLRHAVVAVAGSAGLGHVERIDRRALVILGEDGVRVAMATGAGMVGRIGMHAARKSGSLPHVAGVALHFGDLVRMRITLDIRMAIAAFLAPMNGGRKLLHHPLKCCAPRRSACLYRRDTRGNLFPH